MNRWLFLVLFLFGFSASATFDFAAQLPVERWQLKNGLTVLFHHDPRLPMVSYHTWYRVGSVHELPGQSGLAHMLEHMMFKGAKKYSGKEFDQILHANGIVSNAFTSHEYTGFYQKLPSSRLELVMDMEVDRMSSLKLAEVDVLSEKKVVAEERRWRVDNQPQALLQEKIMATMLSETPYAWPVIGSMADIANYTPENLRKFYEQHYGPENAVLVIAGRFPVRRTKELIEKHYGQLQPRRQVSENVPSPASFAIKQNERRRYELKGQVRSPIVAIVYPGLTMKDEKATALALLAGILGAGESSRLHQELVYRSQLADSVGAYAQSFRMAGLFTIQAEVQAGKSAEAVEKALLRVLQNLKTQPITARELQKAKNIAMKTLIDGLVRLESKAETLAHYEVLYGDYREAFKAVDKINRVTLEDLESVRRAVVRSDRENVFYLVPGE